MTPHPRVSLIIPNKNNEPALDLVFEHLARHTSYRDVEVVVVDDGSTDGSKEILRRWRDGGRFERFILEERPPSGVVVTLNRCVELATGEVCVQLDADATIETPNWIERMLELLLSDDRIGCISPKVVFDSGVVHAYGINVVEPAGFHDRGTLVTEPIGQRTYHQKVERRPEQTAPHGDELAEVDGCIGCCMMYRKADALAVGGYDLGFQPVWFDDLDLSLSIRHKLGKKNFFLPHVRVIHRIGMRNARHQPTRQEVVQARVGKLIPPSMRGPVRERLGLDKPPPDVQARLDHHYAYWKQKWGWDMLNPDMHAVHERYADSELLWATDPEKRRAGEEIAWRYEQAHDRDSPVAARQYLRRFGFLPPPSWSALQDYTHILETIRERGLDRLDGDFLEIGAFLGGGVYQLARLAPARRVIAVDVFAPDLDETAATTGRSMAEIYSGSLGSDGDQREIYDAVTACLDNVETVAGDSATVTLPTEKIAFAHIDGNHSAEYVRSDFEKVWAHVVSGGIVAFDDYGHDLPAVTETIDRLRTEHASEIAEFWVGGEKTAFLRRA